MSLVFSQPVTASAAGRVRNTAERRWVTAPWLSQSTARSSKGLGVVAPRAAVAVDLIGVRKELGVVGVAAQRGRVGDHEQEPAGAGQRHVHPPGVGEEAD